MSNLLVPIGVLVAERLLYLPSIGFCVGLAWLGLVLARRCAPFLASPGLRRAPVAILGVVLLLYGARTYRRNFDWRNPETLYGATAAAAPDCHAAHFNYAAVLLDARKYDLALEQLLEASRIRNDHIPSLINLANAYLNLGRAADARHTALAGLKLSPDSRQLRDLLGFAERQLATHAGR